MENYFDLDTIKQQFTDVLRYSQEFGDVELRGIDTIFDTWYNNKSSFIRKFNGHLSCGMNDISFELDKQAKMDKISHFAGRVYDYYNNPRLATWLEDLSPDEFYNNRTTNEYAYSTAWWRSGEDPTIIIPKNFKVVKAFKFFEDNTDKLKQMQSEASQIIQENIVSGTLCLSVHPLDYLSLSENVHNWRSCHALDGDYRSGNLSYMLDSSTIICYLRADKLGILPHFPETVPWNSKKWRVLLFFSNDKTMLFAGRQYPFFSGQSLEIIKDKLLPQLDFGTWTSWKDTMISSYDDKRSKESFTFSRMIPVGNTLQRFDKIIQEPPNPLHFNDLTRSSCYSPIWSYRRSKDPYWKCWSDTGASSQFTDFKIGTNCICPICGKHDIAFTDMMVCPDCASNYDYNSADYRECEVCGSITHIDDMVDLPLSGAWVCQRCYNMETVRCQECGEIDLPDVIRYWDDTEMLLCRDCHDEKHSYNIEDIEIRIKGE